MTNLKIILRRIFRQKLHSVIIVVSLAIGFGCINLVSLFIVREVSTDKFLEHSDQIYALKSDDLWEPGRMMYHTRYGSAEYMKDNFPEVEDFCRIGISGAEQIIADNETYRDKPRIIKTSDNFFNFFSYYLISGRRESVLETENSLVISDQLARKYFGNMDPVGQVVTLHNPGKSETMVVSGIFETPEENSQLSFEMVRRIGEEDSRCYVKLNPSATRDEVEQILATNKETIPIIHAGTPGKYYLSSLTETYFDTSRRAGFEISRDKKDLWIAMIIGLLVLGIAAFNYLGLLNNKLLGRSQEFSIRLINGGSPRLLISDVIQESTFLILFSFLISLLLTLWALPSFRELLGTNITTEYLFSSKQLTVLLIPEVFLLAITLLFLLVKIFRSAKIKEEIHTRYQIPAVTIFQLSVSISLIICATVIFQQMKFISNMPIGMDKDVIEVKIPALYSDKTSAFKSELGKNVSVQNLSITTASPVLEHFLLLLKYQEGGEEREYSVAGFSGDENYINTLGIELVQGTGFSENPTANEHSRLVNETFAKQFPDRDLIGSNIPGMDNEIIVGIVKDFHYSSLKSVVEPAIIGFNTKGRHLVVKPVVGQERQAREAIQSTWRQLITDYPVQIESVGDRFEWYHRSNENFIKLIGTCTALSIFLSMIGLFALSYLTAHQRIKEIGIRKVNGARIDEILTLLNRNYIKWTLIALVIASPVAWYAMNQWLQSFAYKTNLSWWIFALAGLLALAIAILTVSWQSWKAATRNPIEALRYE
ncbi:MAG: ABC transporter permease [Bacteroidota bacterium]